MILYLTIYPDWQTIEVKAENHHDIKLVVDRGIAPRISLGEIVVINNLELVRDINAREVHYKCNRGCADCGNPIKKEEIVFAVRINGMIFHEGCYDSKRLP